jgi:hypothetical protein
MTAGRYPQVRTLRDVVTFRERLESIGCALPVDAAVAPDGPLSSTLRIGDRELANASDGYQPPEDPLLGVARHVAAATELKRQVPAAAVVASGLSYLQELLPNVGQALVAAGSVDAVGIGRMALAYPDLSADGLAGRALDRSRLCRTFSDCTTAPRNGLISGCWPLDPFCRDHPDRVRLAAIKRGARRG